MTMKRVVMMLGLVAALAATRPAEAGGFWVGSYGPPVVAPVPFGLAGPTFVGGFVPVAPVMPIVVARPVVPVVTPVVTTVSYYSPAPVIVTRPAVRYANRVYRRSVLWGW
jgi:hypothetical protein